DLLQLGEHGLAGDAVEVVGAARGALHHRHVVQRDRFHRPHAERIGPYLHHAIGERDREPEAVRARRGHDRRRGLEVAVIAERLEAGAPELRRDVLRGHILPRRRRDPPAQGVGGQEGEMPAQRIRAHRVQRPPPPDRAKAPARPALPSRSPRNASYSIGARLDPERHTLQGSLVLEWRNTTGQPQTTLPFHLYWNAFRNTLSTAARGEGRRPV